MSTSPAGNRPPLGSHRIDPAPIHHDAAPEVPQNESPQPDVALTQKQRAVRATRLSRQDAKPFIARSSTRHAKSTKSAKSKSVHLTRIESVISPRAAKVKKQEAQASERTNLEKLHGRLSRYRHRVGRSDVKDPEAVLLRLQTFEDDLGKLALQIQKHASTSTVFQDTELEKVGRLVQEQLDIVTRAKKYFENHAPSMEATSMAEDAPAGDTPTLADVMNLFSGLGKVDPGPEQFAAALALKLDGRTFKAYVDAGMPINEATRPGGLTDDLLIQELKPKKLGSGEVGEVLLLAYLVTDSDGRTSKIQRAWKPEPPLSFVPPDQSQLAGIVSPPHLSARAVASARVFDLLVPDEVVANAFAVHVTQTGFAVHDGQLGTLAEFARGKAPMRKVQAEIPVSKETADFWAGRSREELQAFAKSKGFTAARVTLEPPRLLVTRSKFALDEDGRPTTEEIPLPIRVKQPLGDPAYRCALTTMLVVDILCGQVDRHAGNYLVAEDKDGPLRLILIDNDASFGDRLDSGDSTAGAGAMVQNNPFHGSRMPRVVSRAVFDAVMSLDADRIRQALQGLLSETEIQATQSRLKDLQAHFRQLAPDAVIDDLDDWGTAATSERLGVAPGRIESAMALLEAAFKVVSAESRRQQPALMDAAMKDVNAALSALDPETLERLGLKDGADVGGTKLVSAAWQLVHEVKTTSTVAREAWLESEKMEGPESVPLLDPGEWLPG